MLKKHLPPHLSLLPRINFIPYSLPTQRHRGWRAQSGHVTASPSGTGILVLLQPGLPPRDTVPQEQAAPAGIPHGLTSPARSHFHGPAGPSYGLGASLRHLLLRLELQVGSFSIPASAGAPSAFSSSSGRAPGGSGQQRLLGLSPGRALPQSGSANGLREPRGCCRGWASPALAAIG